MAVSPAGIAVIVQVSSRLVVEELFGEEASRGGWRWLNYDPPLDRSEAVWRLETADGHIEKVVPGEYGFLPDGETQVFVGWHSTDGVEWARIPRLHSERVIGTAEGFWTPDQSGMWFSPEGLTWTRVGAVPGYAYSDWKDWLVVGGLVLLRDAQPEPDRPARFLAATPEGIADLPISRRITRALPDAVWDVPAVGPLGLVSSSDDGTPFSASGSSFGVSPNPPAWTLRERADDASMPISRASMTFTVGDDEVLAIRSECPAPKPTAELCGAFGAFPGSLSWETTIWRGTVAESVTEPR